MRSECVFTLGAIFILCGSDAFAENRTHDSSNALESELRFSLQPKQAEDAIESEDIDLADAAVDDAGELARQTQNPVADLISLPFQNNLKFDVGDNDTAYVLNIQPVVPFNLNEDWNLITRTIVPIIYIPGLTDGLPEIPEGEGTDSEFGLGDVNFTAFLSPRDSDVIWGVGPSINVPSASNDALGSEKWSLGPSVVVLNMDGPWVYGALVRQIWSFAGDDDRPHVNQFLLQPFVNYNFEDGWYLTSSPIITADWKQDSDNVWTVPIGGGGGRLVRFGRQPVNLQMQAFWLAESPNLGPEWELRIQVQFLFPK